MEPTVPPPSWPAWRILAATLPLFGISFCFELYAVLNQPYLAELHLSPQASALCQGLGQACAFVTQPLAGYCMDRSPSRHGPRRVCLAVGAALTAVSQLWCGFASRVAGAFFAPGSAPHATFVLAWAVLGVALFNIAVNVEFVALRALVLANLPEHLQAAGAAAQVLMLGLANAACGLIMLGLDLHAQTGRWAELYPVVAPIACMATVLSAHPALVFVEDPPTAAPEPPRNAASHLWSELRAMERRLWWAMLALFLGWLAFTPSQQFAGTVHSIRVTTEGTLAMSAATVLSAPLIPALLRKVGGSWTQVGCAVIALLAQALLLGGVFAPALRSQTAVVLCLGLLGPLNAALNSVHLVAIGTLAPRGSRGLYAGFFNCAVVAAQAVDAGLIAALRAWCGPPASVYVGFAFALLLVPAALLAARKSE
ncbi:Major facilitator superfamily protein [Spironucleus salmonicida]|uniref:Major facilitator superfamily protein n=1 Tax=Spironucleus salmonicida TaxID=348837 RepID=A0A9P8S274_9EUKA|nr:Major facilitator superfamily protein [Spironucleus salmonicida]